MLQTALRPFFGWFYGRNEPGYWTNDSSSRTLWQPSAEQVTHTLSPKRRIANCCHKRITKCRLTITKASQNLGTKRCIIMLIAKMTFSRANYDSSHFSKLICWVFQQAVISGDGIHEGFAFSSDCLVFSMTRLRPANRPSSPRCALCPCVPKSRS